MLRSVDDFDSQHFAFHADSALPDAGKTVISIDDSPNGPTATIPDAHLLFNAEFKRAGSDLILNGDDGKTATVRDYFASDKHPMLLSREGAALAPDVVAALAGPPAAGQYAQATPAQTSAQAVGRVAVATGNATIVRNGVAIAVHTGDAVLKGDVLQTGSGTMGVTFNDGSTLNLTANSRLVVNEFVFDPHGTANSEILNLVQGSLTFISGQVAHTGDMKIGTPVATMGIRGTVGGAEVHSNDGTARFYVSQSATGAVILDQGGNVIANVVQDGPLIVVRPAGPLQVLAEAVQKTPQELAYELSELQHIVNVQAIGQQIIQQDQNNPNPQSNDHPHTQFQIDVPSGGHNSDSTDGGDGAATGGDGTATVQVTTIKTDQTNTTTPEPIIYTVEIPSNLPPVIFAPLQATVSENQPHVFSRPDEIPSVADPDTSVLTVMLTAVHGTASLDEISGLTFTLGDGQADPAMTFSGLQADINAALASLSFTPEPNYLGPASITFKTSDGQSTTTETISLTVETNNEAPVIAGVTSTEGVSAAHFSAVAAAYLTANHDLINTLGGTAGFGDAVTFQPDYTGAGGARSDDGSTLAINIAAIFGAGLDFFGHTYNSLYINSNGNITFGGPNSSYTPSQITAGVNNPIIAPFWADVDTRGGAAAATPGGNSTGSNQVYYSLDADNHVVTVTWDDVGFYGAHTNALDAFQLQLIGIGDGNFDIVFRYEDINWTSGDASGGSGGLGGTAARAGYSAGDGVHYFELGGSGDQSAMLALDNTSGNTGIAGVDIFQVLSGNVSAASVANGTIQFTDANPADTHMATEQANGANYIGTFALDDPANNNSNVTEANGSTPGSVDWHFNLTSSELNGLPIGDTVTQSYNVTIDDGQPGGQMTQTVAISWGSVAADTFTFQPGIGTDTVLNFQLGSDAIDFNNGQDSAHLGPTMTADQTNHILSLLMSNTTGDAVLNFGHGDTVTLAGISATDLQHSINHIIV
jgi:hypothetical protein